MIEHALGIQIRKECPAGMVQVYCTLIDSFTLQLSPYWRRTCFRLKGSNKNLGISLQPVGSVFLLVVRKIMKTIRKCGVIEHPLFSNGLHMTVCRRQEVSPATYISSPCSESLENSLFLAIMCSILSPSYNCHQIFLI